MKIQKGRKFLIVGASGDLGFAVLKMLSHFPVVIGAHCHRNKSRLDRFIKRPHKAKIKLFQGDVSSQEESIDLVDSFRRWAGGIDGLVQLSGSVHQVKDWDAIDQSSWDRDIAVNLTGPFFLAREAMKQMKKKGGKIVLTSTASASHGGGNNSMAYGASKAGIECITKGLARVGAQHNILVNTVAPGLIETKFHRVQMRRGKKQIKDRAKLVPLKKAGEPDDVAGMITYLLSPMGNYITGHVMNVSGGDWL